MSLSSIFSGLYYVYCHSGYLLLSSFDLKVNIYIFKKNIYLENIFRFFIDSLLCYFVHFVIKDQRLFTALFFFPNSQGINQALPYATFQL